MRVSLIVSQKTTIKIKKVFCFNVCIKKEMLYLYLCTCTRICLHSSFSQSDCIQSGHFLIVIDKVIQRTLTGERYIKKRYNMF